MRPTLVLNPRDDPTFETMAGSLLEGADAPCDLETALRATYPDASVHARDMVSEPGLVWYVYRDGQWVPGGDGAAARGQ